MASSPRRALGELQWKKHGGTVTKTYHPGCGRTSILYGIQETHKVKKVFRSWVQCKEYLRSCGYNDGLKKASPLRRSKRQPKEKEKTVLPLAYTLSPTTYKDDHKSTSSTTAVKDSSACPSPIRRPLTGIEHAQQPASDKVPNPSYRESKDKSFKPSKKRTKLACAVLNDSFVSYDSRGRPFQEVQKNQYEKILFRCEDDHFELDMLVEWATNTKRRLTDLWHDIRRNRFKPVSKQIHTGTMVDKHLSALNFRSIERIYDDDGSEIIDLLRMNPVIALPKIFIRLQQKRNEWSRSRREEMSEVWAKACSKNDDKSPGPSNS